MDSQQKSPDAGRDAPMPPTVDPGATRYSDPTSARAADPDATRYSSLANGGAATPAVAAVPGYEILGELGRGGMGVVYLARHVKLDRAVALKMILTAGHAGEADLARFKTEAETVARLQHPNIVQIFEVGEHGGLPFFSLEFCPGGNLAQKLKGTPLPPREAAALVEKLARAMHAAHEKGVLHRDLKPANVLLADDGAPKITDFGLAKKLDADAGRTRTGAVMGTPSYMAPEQAGGKSKEIGPACDVYALGAILYECLTGRPPFKAATEMETMMQVLSDDPAPPRQLQSKTPRDVETICLKCLSKEPARRYASAAALAEDLRRFQAGEPVQARPVGRLERAVKWAKRRPALAGLLGVTLSALVALAVLSANLVVARSDAENKRKDAEKQTRVALEKEGAARQEAEKAKKARDFLVSIFHIAETDVQGGNITARQILARAEKRIPDEFADQPELRGELLAAIGEVNRGIGRKTPQAMILEVRGTVQLQSAAGENKAAVPQALVNLDDRLTLSADGQVQLVFLSDFHKERLKPGRAATVDWKGCEPADAVLERDDSILMTFVRLPKGTFYMGWDGTKKGVKTEIAEDFEIAVHDVTQGQWQAVMGENPSWFKRDGGGSGYIRDVSDEELKLFPVEQVSWDDAQAFIRKLNEKERGSEWR